MTQTQRTPRHQDNRLLAALEPEDFASLEPHLTIVDLPRGQVLYEAGETVKYTYFPLDAMVSLVTMMRDGKSAEMALFGCEGLFGLVSAFVTRQAFGRYIVQLGGSASRIELARMHAAMASRPAIQRLVLRYTKALMAQTLQRSTVSEVTRTLQDKGLIQQGRGMITVVDRPALQQAACECYQIIRQRYQQLLPQTYARD
jgi:CRP-like cAMP-binding protein